MRHMLLMIHKVPFRRNDRRRYVKTCRYREQTRSWNNFYLITTNIMHKHYMVDHLEEEENMFNIRIIDIIGVGARLCACRRKVAISSRFALDLLF